MKSFVISHVEGGVDVIQGAGRMLALSKDRTTIDVVGKDVEVVRLIRKPAVVSEHVLPALAFPRLDSGPDRSRLIRSKQWSRWS